MFLNVEVDPGQAPPDMSDEQIECLKRPGQDLNFEEDGNTYEIGTFLEQPESRDIKQFSNQSSQYEFVTKIVGANPRNILAQTEILNHFVVEKCSVDSKNRFSTLINGIKVFPTKVLDYF